MAKYDLEVNPEFPGAGNWGCPAFGISVARGEVTVDGGDSVYDGPAADLVVRVEDSSGHRWVGFFAGGMGGITRVMPTPDPHRLLVVADGEGYLVPASSPRDTERIALRMPIRSIIDEGDVILLASWIDVAAVGTSGTLWISERLCLDDLKVEGVIDGRVECRGFFGEPDEDPITLDVRTGEQVGGRALPDDFR